MRCQRSQSVSAKVTHTSVTSWSRRYERKSETNEARRTFLHQREISCLKVHITTRHRGTAGCSHIAIERSFLCVRAFDLESRCVAINSRAGRDVTTSRIYVYVYVFWTCIPISSFSRVQRAMKRNRNELNFNSSFFRGPLSIFNRFFGLFFLVLLFVALYKIWRSI